jgi:hypothetical protein
MRSFLAVSAAVLVYTLGLMMFTGTSVWNADATDREAAALFGGQSCDFGRLVTCQAAPGFTCPALIGVGKWGTNPTFRVYVPPTVIQAWCAGQTSTTCGYVFWNLQAGCP